MELRHNYVYPGHALVIAICIMEKYPNMQEAYDKGMEQAKALEPRFRELRAKWDNKYVRQNDG